jgi:2-aminomuconate deaminase
MSKTFESSRTAEAVGAFPHANRVGEFLFLSGIGPHQRGSKEIPGVTLDSAGNVVSYDIEAQCRAVGPFNSHRPVSKTGLAFSPVSI